MATASKSNPYSRSQLEAYGWRAFWFEFLSGIVTVTWYLLFLAETTTLKGLTRLDKFAAPAFDDLSDDGGARNVPPQDDSSYSELQDVQSSIEFWKWHTS
jgi:hypothetical protein